jgi:hypothetical protein
MIQDHLRNLLVLKCGVHDDTASAVARRCERKIKHGANPGSVYPDRHSSCRLVSAARGPYGRWTLRVIVGSRFLPPA